jgi:DNA uptake protein ComE-like DNA-binding protein
MKEWFLAYVTFSRKERLGIVALILLLSLIWLLPAWWGIRTGSEQRLYTILADSLASTKKVRPAKIYPFDPNLIPDSTWLSFGVPERSVRMIRNYLQKGGRFRKPEALLSIYGIDTPIARALIPYVRIEPAGGTASTYRSSGLSQVDVTSIDPRFRKPPRQPLGQVDINRADSAELEALPWIGEKLAGRITRFRDACGGLYAIDQLAGMYGLSDTVFLHFRPFLRLGKKELRRLRINTWPVDSLVTHPYIQYRQAKALVAFRAQHGLYKNGEDLLKVAVVDSLWLERIRPYLTFD